MKNQEVIHKLVDELSKNFDDFQGLYFFGSRIKAEKDSKSDYDFVLIFDSLHYEKKLDIGGIISYLEYQLNIQIDYKLFTKTGKRSIDYIRKNVNPYFIEQAIDNGIFYDSRK